MAVESTEKLAKHLFEEICKVEADIEKRITFVEASHNGGFLPPEKLCSIESAAISNPDMSVYVYFHSLSPEETINQLNHFPSLKKIRNHYKNVVLVAEDLNKFLIGTRLVNLTKKTEWGQGPYATKHLADATRAAMLYIYGGISLDWGIIVMRSLKCLKNLARQDIWNETSSLQNDVMIFDRRHKLIDIYMRIVDLQYDATEEESVGSSALTRAGQVLCDVPDLINTKGEGFICRNNLTMIVPYTDAFKRISSITDVTLSDKHFTHFKMEKFGWSYAILVAKGKNYYLAPKFHISLTSLFCPLSYST